MTQCNRCKGEIKWPENYSPGNKPNNMDGSPHNCPAQGSPQSKPAQAVARPEVPIEQLVAEITAIQGTMMESMVTGIDEVEKKLHITEAMIEGIWKYAISRKMAR